MQRNTGAGRAVGRSETADVALRVDDVHKSYGDTRALRGVSFDVRRGEMVALLGRNGAGKTTLASLVLGLRRRDAGTILVGGIDPEHDARAVRERTGLVPQDLGIYPVLTVRENLAVFGEIARLRGPALAARVDRIAEALDLASLLGRRAGTLSGGERRRLHVGMALLHEPAMLLLDEPTVGADVESRMRILTEVRRLADGGTAICYTTHYLQEVEQLGASVVIIDGGRVLASGTVDELVAAHGDAMVELRFDGPAPSLRIGRRQLVDNSTLRLFGRDGGGLMTEALRALNGSSARLERVEVQRPSLEAVYLSLTGHRTADATAGEDA